MEIKKFLVSICVLLVSMVMYSQSRVNIVMPKLYNKTKTITKGIGWAYNENIGKWFSNLNVIDTKKVHLFWKSHIDQNFNSIQMANIDINGEKFYVLLFERDSGYYHYETIQEDWQETLSKFYFVIDEFSYNRMKESIEGKTGETISLRSIREGVIDNKFSVLGAEYAYNEENLVASILQERNSLSSAYIFEFNVQKLEGEDIARFLLPRSTYYMGEGLDKRYFEVSLFEFRKLLID
ncbi:hypothetical protein ACPDHL_11950 [Myroides sp. C15-4]|uniref:hypothetical protein n=1 Tax=Myroides sp. C15-4 TaxID=3400532 RepID=UPI003D2F9539